MHKSLPVVLCALLATALQGQVSLPSVIGPRMVLQRDAKLPIWGRASPGEEVTVTFRKQEFVTKADAEGRWKVVLDPCPAGGPHRMVVEGKNRIEVPGILVGEVWVCSGQSNMQWAMSRSARSKEFLAAAKAPKVRLFTVPRRPASRPMPDCDAEWVRCHPDTARSFSAVAYHFGRKLHAELGAPIGLIHTSWGGTRVEPWVPREGYLGNDKLAAHARNLEAADAQQRKAQRARLPAYSAWLVRARDALASGQNVPEPPEWPRHAYHNRGHDTALFNGMIAPLIPFAIRGAIWYQGESNVRQASRYQELFATMIRGWRQVWGQGEFPFYFVQLAPFRYGGQRPENCALLRDAQTGTMQTVASTGMAVTMDIGNPKDIHPRNKHDVGRRLALWALRDVHGRDVQCCGPLYRRTETEDGRLRLHFEHAKGLRVRDGKPVSWLRIAGKDRVFRKAQSKIEGETLVVWSEQVPVPVAVRYGWHAAAEPNLCNGAGLPAVPFRTDAWPIPAQR